MDSLTKEQLREIILKHGFYHQQDFIAGKRVDEMSDRGFPFKTDDGLNLCKASTFDNEVSTVTIYKMRLIYLLVRSSHSRVSVPLVWPWLLQSFGS